MRELVIILYFQQRSRACQARIHVADRGGVSGQAFQFQLNVENNIVEKINEINLTVQKLMTPVSTVGFPAARQLSPSLNRDHIIVSAPTGVGILSSVAKVNITNTPQPLAKMRSKKSKKRGMVDARW